MKKLIYLVVVCILFLFSFAACKPFDKPEIVTIEPSQTAFLIPLDGKTSDQKEFMSEDFLKSSKVATKQVLIPHRWLQEGRTVLWNETGRWIPTMKLIVVERKPETREWTESQTTGTSTKNEGITAESMESIGFMARMNCSAQIDEDSAVRFLYRYNNKSLSDVMDTEIRARVESKFVEECAKRKLDDILVQKEAIMNSIREDVVSYFADRGITINTLGLKGEFTYLNPEIQTAIDAKFSSEQQKVTQANLNAVAVSKAEADKKVIETQTETIEKSLELKKLENQAKAIEKWDGKLPTYIGGDSGSIFNIPTK
jgi:hypothetical protein